MGRSKESVQRKIRRRANRRNRGNRCAMFLIAGFLIVFGVVMCRNILTSRDQLATLQAEEQRLEEALTEQEARASDLEEQRVYVTTKAYVEEVAKKLGLVYPDEVIFKPAE